MVFLVLFVSYFDFALWNGNSNRFFLWLSAFVTVHYKYTFYIFDIFSDCFSPPNFGCKHDLLTKIRNRKKKSELLRRWLDFLEPNIFEIWIYESQNIESVTDLISRLKFKCAITGNYGNLHLIKSKSAEILIIQHKVRERDILSVKHH